MSEIKIQIQPSFSKYGRQFEYIQIGRLLENQKYTIPRNTDKLVISKEIQGSKKYRYARVKFFQGEKYLGCTMI